MTPHNNPLNSQCKITAVDNNRKLAMDVITGRVASTATYRGLAWRFLKRWGVTDDPRTHTPPHHPDAA